MMYMITFFYLLSFVFFCLTISTFLAIPKAKMYPPKKVLKQRMALYMIATILFFFIAWSLH
ncbi:hypothetical protein GGR02_002648 [Anoxybacillus voinovskiensis]|uniref:Uncharacterized protein n=1 Tax=Anoxybacteroides voinovskiense TaxID=230470 RepID=A0A840DTE9_9BACL|nr:hypothetical protein [Anoxybacillus voinovskiensis]MBB4074855.1 hypothetical protein [Anoxybacillus voinovskiensis]GGJ74057.1 hypothetical protein GCM10008982_24040 [Anoxybacillus voinovskiensis]